MVNSLADRFSLLQSGIRGVRTFDKIGIVRRVIGLVIESEGPEVSIGQVCSISSERTQEKIEAQVIGFRENTVLLMALNSVHLIHPGCKVVSKRNSNEVPYGPPLLGRIIDGMGRPLDGMVCLLNLPILWRELSSNPHLPLVSSPSTALFPWGRDNGWEFLLGVG
jgi:flagellum-specific ATP synthase